MNANTQHPQSPATHTATPWHIVGSSLIAVKHPEYEWEPVASVCGETREERYANAQFIVRACNSHEALVAALKNMTDAYAKVMEDAGVTHYPEALAIVRQSRSALATAQRKP